LNDILKERDFLTRVEERNIAFWRLPMKINDKGKLVQVQNADKDSFSCRGGSRLLATPPENPVCQRPGYVQEDENMETEKSSRTNGSSSPSTEREETRTT
jgi:hypothetical protein